MSKHVHGMIMYADDDDIMMMVWWYVAVEENELFDFRGLRMDWYRLQVCIRHTLTDCEIDREARTLTNTETHTHHFVIASLYDGQFSCQYLIKSCNISYFIHWTLHSLLRPAVLLCTQTFCIGSDSLFCPTASQLILFFLVKCPISLWT